MGCMTVTMSIFNAIFWLLGGSMLGVYGWVLVGNETYSYIHTVSQYYIRYLEAALYLIVSVGAAITLIGFFWCLRVRTGSKRSSVFYGIFLVLTILAELAAIGLVAFYYASMDDVSEDLEEDLFWSYVSETSSDPSSVAWNNMQLKWECCGSFGYGDYSGSHFQSNANSSARVPWTCCVMKHNVQPKYATKDDVLDYTMCQLEAVSGAGVAKFLYLHPRGCSDDLKDVMDVAAPITLGVLSGLVVIQLIALGMSCALRKKNEDLPPYRKM